MCEIWKIFNDNSASVLYKCIHANANAYILKRNVSNRIVLYFYYNIQKTRFIEHNFPGNFKQVKFI